MSICSAVLENWRLSDNWMPESLRLEDTYETATTMLGFGDTARGVPYEGPATRRQRFLSLITGQMQQLLGQVTVTTADYSRVELRSCPSPCTSCGQIYANSKVN